MDRRICSYRQPGRFAASILIEVVVNHGAARFRGFRFRLNEGSEFANLPGGLRTRCGINALCFGRGGFSSVLAWKHAAAIIECDLHLLDLSPNPVTKMIDFDIKRSSRQCSKTERELKPGDVFYSVLVEKDGETERIDIFEEAWEGPPDPSIGWWKCRVPEIGKGRVYWAPNNVLLAYFDQLTQQPEKQETAYVVALLLIRKRLLKIQDSMDDPTTLQLRSSKLDRSYAIPVLEINAARVTAIQQELSEHLFTDQSPDLESDADDDERQQPAE